MCTDRYTHIQKFTVYKPKGFDYLSKSIIDFFRVTLIALMEMFD